jgi:hypothetical protein
MPVSVGGSRRNPRPHSACHRIRTASTRAAPAR